MKNSLVLLAVVLSVAAFAGMMRIKTDVQTMDRERLRLVNERAQLRETKRVLEAEWALLASPERLEKLVRGKDYVPASALDIVPLIPPAGSVVSGSQPALAGVSASVVVSSVLGAAVSETAAVTVTATVVDTAPSATPVVISATQAE